MPKLDLSNSPAIKKKIRRIDATNAPKSIAKPHRIRTRPYSRAYERGYDMIPKEYEVLYECGCRKRYKTKEFPLKCELHEKEIKRVEIKLKD